MRLNGNNKRQYSDQIEENTVGDLDLSRFHHFNREGVATSVFDFEVFDFVKQNYSIFVCGCPYLYSGGVYVADHNGTKIKQIIRRLLYKQFVKSRVINQIYNLIIEAEELQKDFSSLNNHPKSYINFMDCMLDAKTMEKIPHNPDFLSINQVPFRYRDVEQAETGKEIEKFFDFIFSHPDDREMLLEYAGLSYTTDTSQQIFLTLCGLGGTGKSILIRLIENSVGIANVSNVSMQELNKRFSTSLLVGKTLNSCADLSVEALEDASTLKKLLGEDFVLAEFKGQNAFMFKNYSKMLFSTNMLPNITAERTNGFYRRLAVLKMDRRPEQPDTELADKLMKETPYFIKLSIQALNRMYQRGNILISEGSKQAVLQMRKDSDVVQAWLDDNCSIASHLKAERVKAYDDFKNYCENEERQALTRNGFFKALRVKNFSEIRGKNERYFAGFSVGKVTVKCDGNDEFVTVTDQEFEELPFL